MGLEIVNSSDIQNSECQFLNRGDYYDCLHSAGARGQKFEDLCDACRKEIFDGILMVSAALTSHLGDVGSLIQAERFVKWAEPWARHQRLVLER